MTVEIRALRREDDRQGFRSGDEALDLFFRRFAGQNQFRHHIGVTYVAVEQRHILGFLTVSPATLDADDLPSGRKMPAYPLPVLRVARLGVDETARGRGIGRSLLRFSIELAEQMQHTFGCIGLLVDAKENATGFYRQYGFETISAVQGGPNARPAPTMMYLPLGAVPPARP